MNPSQKVTAIPRKILGKHFSGSDTENMGQGRASGSCLQQSMHGLAQRWGPQGRAPSRCIGSLTSRATAWVPSTWLNAEGKDPGKCHSVLISKNCLLWHFKMAL